MSEAVEQYAAYDPSEPEFRLTNSHNQFNCFVNAIVQIIWHVDTLKSSVEEFARLSMKLKDGKPEFKVIMCLQTLFSEAIKYN